MAGRTETSTTRTTIAPTLASTSGAASHAAAYLSAGSATASAPVAADAESTAATEQPAPRRSRRNPEVDAASTASASEPKLSASRHADAAGGSAAAAQQPAALPAIDSLLGELFFGAAHRILWHPLPRRSGGGLRSGDRTPPPMPRSCTRSFDLLMPVRALSSHSLFARRDPPAACPRPAHRREPSYIMLNESRTRAAAAGIVNGIADASGRLG